MGIFQNRKKNDHEEIETPLWFMRQAGRYHGHYQNLKKSHDFMTLCKNPDLATEVTMGPIDEFGFDAAILFSDLLFPLEQLKMGLHYNDGPPKLAYKIKGFSDLKKLGILENATDFYNFQYQALKNLKTALPKDVSLLGFVGAPFTLYTYAVEGGHSGSLIDSKCGLYTGLYQGFLEILYPQLLENMLVQAKASPDAICLFDTAAGELSLQDYKTYIAPTLRRLAKSFKELHPEIKLVYYSKMTHLSYLEELDCPHFDVLGIDWRVSLVEALKKFGPKHYIQGNFDPALLSLPWPLLEKRLKSFFLELKESGANLDHWIMGLGHGVIKETPQENVKRVVELVHKSFTY